MNFQMLGIHNLLMEQKIKGMAPEQGNQGQLVVTGNQEIMIIASGKFRPLLGLKAMFVVQIVLVKFTV